MYHLDHKSIIYIYIYIYISDGLGWTEEQKNILIRENEIQLDLCQIQLDFTFPENLTEFTEKVFTQPTRPNSKVKSFTWFLLSGDESEENINWEQFECPMSFSQCHYDWCATSDNSAMVNILFSKYNIYMI
jgi:hypothetical protein